MEFGAHVAAWATIRDHFAQGTGDGLRAAAQLFLQRNECQAQVFAAVAVFESAPDVVRHVVVKDELRFAQCQVVHSGLALGKLDIDLGSPVANHDVVEQAAQGWRVFWVAGIALIDKMPAKGTYSAKLARRKDRDEAVEFHQVVLYGGCGEHEHIALAHAIDKLPGTRAAVLELMCFVDDQEVILAPQDCVAVVVKLGAMQAHNPATAFRFLHFFPLARRFHDPERLVELAFQLFAPLFRQ